MEKDQDFSSLFYQIIKFFETRKHEEALHIIQENCNIPEFINATDERPGFVEECFQYRYDRIKRKGFTLLHYAVLYELTDVVDILIKSGADLQYDYDTHSSPLHFACMLGTGEVVELLLHSLPEERCKELVNKPNRHNWTPLNTALESNNKDAVKILLDKGADPSVRDKDQQRNALHLAAWFSSPDIVQDILSSRHGKMKLDINGGDIKGMTPLHIACKENMKANVQILLDNGADPTVINYQGLTSCEVAILNGAEECVLVQLSHFKKPLSLACVERLMKRVVKLDNPKILLSFLAKCNPVHVIKASTILHQIVKSESYSDEEFTEVVNKLGKPCIEFEDEEKRTPILLAASLNKFKQLDIMLKAYTRILRTRHCEHKHDNMITKQDTDGLCAIHLAVKCSGPDINFKKTCEVLESLRHVKSLTLCRDEDLLSMVNRDGQSGVNFAMKLGKARRANMILEVSKCRIAGEIDGEGNTIIHNAIASKISALDFKEMITLLLKSDLDLTKIFNARNNEKKTALHMALETNLPLHVALLVNLKFSSYFDIGASSINHDRGYIVDLNVMDGQGKTALCLAIDHNSSYDIIRRLFMRDSTISDNGNMQLSLPQRTVITTDLCEVVLNAAISVRRKDVIEMMLVNGIRVHHSILKRVIIDLEDKELAYLFVRHGENILTPLSEVLTSDDGKEMVLFHHLIRKMPDVAKEALNRSYDCSDDTGESEMVYNFKLLDKHNTDNHHDAESPNVCEASKKRCTQYILPDPMEVMVDNKRLALLEHPVVHNWLQYKWFGFGFILYIIQLFGYMCFLGPLSALIQVLNHPLLDICSLNSSNFTTNNAEIDGDVGIILLTGAIIFIVVLLHLLVDLVSIIILFILQWHQKIYILRNVLSKMIRLPAFICSLVLVLSIFLAPGSGCPTAWQLHIGLFAVTYGWIYFILLTSKLPLVGVYTIIYSTITITFTKLVLFALLLSLGTSVVFSVVFFDSRKEKSPFFQFGSTLVKVITMTIGELQYEDIFDLSYNNVERENPSSPVGQIETFPRTAQIVWIIFIVLTPVLLSNMLTGLAVGDVKDIQDNADLRKRAKRVKWVIDFENLVPVKSRSLFCKCHRKIASCMNFPFVTKHLEASKKIIEDLQSYKKKRESEIEDIRNGLSPSIQSRDKTETMDTTNVEKTVSNCEIKIEEFKLLHNETLKKMKDELKKDLLAEINPESNN